ncbi:MAG: internalin [Candidatus Delongbacteria bacterium]|nr:MAG: internalin [Candidatus Delongbacteria bacterium]
MKIKFFKIGLLLLFGVFLSTAAMAQQMAHKANATRAFGITPAGSNDNSSSRISDTDIPATTVSHNYRDVNMDRYITLTVTNGEDIRIELAADASNTPVKIVSGDEVSNVTVGTSWTGYSDYSAGATTMTIYGDIKKFGCVYNRDKLTGLDLSHNTALTYLDCFNNQLTSLDVSGATALTKLWCYGNQLTSLDVSQNTALTKLSCSGNQLTSLDVSGATALTELSCDNNQLTSLDVSGATALTYLSCRDNQLTSLDVSQNTVLTGLWCSENQLTSLDVSGATALTYIDCFNNQLTSLDVSSATALTKLSCSGNQLTSLDVSQNTALTKLWCFGNPFTTEAVDNLFCSLPERESSYKEVLYILNNTSDTNKDEVLASNKQNAIDKNWNVWYYDDDWGSLQDTDIPATTGDYDYSNGISDMAADNIELYPNPVHDVLHIELSENNFGVELYNMFGQKVLHVQNEREISVSKLASGIYMLKITTEKGIYSRKIVKE